MQSNPIPAPVQPRESRAKVRVAGRMAGEFTPDQPVTLRDLSTFGAGGVAHDAVPDIGETVTIVLATGDTLSGHVRWTDGDTFGLRLAAPFDTRRLAEGEAIRARIYAGAAA